MTAHISALHVWKDPTDFSRNSYRASYLVRDNNTDYKISYGTELGSRFGSLDDAHWAAKDEAEAACRHLNALHIGQALRDFSAERQAERRGEQAETQEEQ